ncbi:MAG: rRNA pseudouridine synthase [Ruminococcaceae bacterium]|nr:rRNA pseudouridine synthase [Oscillospiraceae bacterium]MBR3596322.1 rRNA pseudouridine synthase [Clostridia bacterium]
MGDNVRLDKYLSSQLNVSRNDAKKLLRGGSVTVNGTVTKKGDVSVKPYEDTVAVSGHTLEYKKYIYIMQHKPKGVVSASVSPSDVTVIDILPEELRRSGLFPAGRLDKDTTGFVLITDDGEFAHNILSPSHHVEKTYLAETGEILTDDDIKRFLDGMKVGEDVFRPAGIKFMEKHGDNYVYEVKICEGRYHQIRRMFASCGKPLLELSRIKIGELSLSEDLLPGQSREISPDELKKIREKSL